MSNANAARARRIASRIRSLRACASGASILKRIHPHCIEAAAAHIGANNYADLSDHDLVYAVGNYANAQPTHFDTAAQLEAGERARRARAGLKVDPAILDAYRAGDMARPLFSRLLTAEEKLVWIETGRLPARFIDTESDESHASNIP